MGTEAFGIVITAKSRHGDLWEFRQRCGSSTKAADELGLHQTVFGMFMNLRRYPSEKTWVRIESAMLLATGKSFDELWPAELRRAIDEKLLKTDFWIRRDFELHELADAFQSRMMLPDASAPVEFDEEISRLMERCEKALRPREWKVLQMRLGLHDNEPMSLRDVGTELRIGKERVRQIEQKALRKLQDLVERHELSEDDLDYLIRLRDKAHP